MVGGVLDCSFTTEIYREPIGQETKRVEADKAMRLEDLQTGLSLVGLEPSVVATIAAVVPIGTDSVQVFYRTPDGQTKERLLGRGDEENISIATSESPWSFDGDAESFKLAVEAKRIDLACQEAPKIRPPGGD